MNYILLWKMEGSMLIFQEINFPLPISQDQEQERQGMKTLGIE